MKNSSIKEKLTNLSATEEKVLIRFIHILDRLNSEGYLNANRVGINIQKEIAYELDKTYDNTRKVFSKIYRKLGLTKKFGEDISKIDKLKDWYLLNKEIVDRYLYIKNTISNKEGIAIEDNRKFIQWLKDKLTPEQIWDKISSQALPNRLLFEPYKKIKKADIKMFGDSLHNNQTFLIDTKICCHTFLERPSYILLLCKFSSGGMYFVSPSYHFVSDISYPSGKWICPQPNAPEPFFELRGALGIEEWIGIISHQKITLDWLPQNNKECKKTEPKKLNSIELKELFNWIVSQPCEVISAEYEILSK